MIQALQDPDMIAAKLDPIDRWVKIGIFGLLFFSTTGLAKWINPDLNLLSLKGVKVGKIARLGLVGSYCAVDLNRLRFFDTDKQLFGRKVGALKSIQNIGWAGVDATCLIMFVQALVPYDFGRFGTIVEQVCNVAYVTAASTRSIRALRGEENSKSVWADFSIMVATTFAPNTIIEAFSGLASGLQVLRPS